MALGFRIFLYAIFLVAGLCFLVAAVLHGSWLSAGGSALFIVGEASALAYLGRVRKDRRRDDGP